MADTERPGNIKESGVNKRRRRKRNDRQPLNQAAEVTTDNECCECGEEYVDDAGLVTDSGHWVSDGAMPYITVAVTAVAGFAAVVATVYMFLAPKKHIVLP